MAGAIIDSTSVHWNTPKWLVDLVSEALGGIDLDPCSNDHSIVPAGRKVQLPEDGLAVDWTEYSRVYVNPPYGRGISKWIENAWLASTKGSHVIMVIPAAVDTKHWHRYVWRYAAAICFLKGRVKFDLPDKTCPLCKGEGQIEATYGYEMCDECEGERTVKQALASSTVPTAVVLFTQNAMAAHRFQEVFHGPGHVIMDPNENGLT